MKKKLNDFAVFRYALVFFSLKYHTSASPNPWEGEERGGSL